MLAAAVSGSVTETAAYAIVRDSVFGALLLLALVALAVLTKILLSVQDKRIADLQSINYHVEQREEKNAALLTSMTTALNVHTKALETLERAYVEHTRVIAANTEGTRRLENTVDSVLRDHARIAAKRSLSPPTMSSPRGLAYPPRAEYSKGPRGGK